MKFSLHTRLLFYRFITGFFLLALAFIAGTYYHAYKAAPDLKRLYMQSMQVIDQPPVVFVHGVMGGKLRDRITREELWIGAYDRVLTSDYSDLAVKIDSAALVPLQDAIEAFDVADGIFGKDFYGKIISTLHDIGGYKLAKPGEKIDKTQKNYYVFYYDWRQDNAVTAALLADFIDQIQEDYGNPDLKVDIVAHSMGGLITRYYIRYGRVDVLNRNDFPVNMYGGKRVRRVILLGTPNLGSIKIMNFFIDGIKVGGSEKIKTETMATMPSLYQLFPHPLNNWIVTSKGKPLDRDLFDV